MCDESDNPRISTCQIEKLKFAPWANKGTILINWNGSSYFLRQSLGKNKAVPPVQSCAWVQMSLVHYHFVIPSARSQSYYPARDRQRPWIPLNCRHAACGIFQTWLFLYISYKLAVGGVRVTLMDFSLRVRYWSWELEAEDQREDWSVGLFTRMFLGW